MSYKDSEYIRQLAVNTYPPGYLLKATFRIGHAERFIYYYNPKDIPVSIWNYGRWLLFSVKRWVFKPKKTLTTKKKNLGFQWKKSSNKQTNKQTKENLI